MKAIALSLKTLTTLKTLNLFRNQIGKDVMKSLASSIESLDHLRPLYTEPLIDMTKEESFELSLIISHLFMFTRVSRGRSFDL